MKIKLNMSLIVKSAETDIELRKLPSKKEAEVEVLRTKNKLEKLKKENASYKYIQNANLQNLRQKMLSDLYYLKRVRPEDR